jgi:hypothetical protein
MLRRYAVRVDEDHADIAPPGSIVGISLLRNVVGRRLRELLAAVSAGERRRMLFRSDVSRYHGVVLVLHLPEQHRSILRIRSVLLRNDVV